MAANVSNITDGDIPGRKKNTSNFAMITSELAASSGEMRIFFLIEKKSKQDIQTNHKQKLQHGKETIKAEVAAQGYIHTPPNYSVLEST